MKVKLSGAALDPTTLKEIRAEGVKLTAHADELSVDSITGPAKIRSRLDEGRLGLSFTPHFSLSVRRERADELSEREVTRRLREIGLSDEQIGKVVELVDATTFEGLSEGEPVPLNEDAGLQVSGEQEPGSRELGLKLPRIRLDPDLAIDVRKISIPNIEAEGNTHIEAPSPDLAAIQMDDFEYEVKNVDAVTLDRAEVQNFRMSPISIPTFGLKNIHTELRIPQLGSKALPISFQTEKGGAQIDIKLADWRPRWSKSAHFNLLVKKITVKVEFGLDVGIRLRYRWILELLDVAVVFRDVFLKGIRASLHIGRLLFNDVKIGLLRVGSLVLSKS